MFSNKCLLVVACMAGAAFARSAPRSSAEAPTYLGDMRLLFKTYQECATQDLSSCLKLKLVTALDRAARSYGDVSVVDGVTLVRDPNAPVDQTPAKSENELDASLPRSLSEKEDTLNGLIFDKIIKMVSSHTLQVKLPSAEEMQRSLTDSEEGRGRRKKMAPFVIMSLMIVGTLVPLAFGALSLLAGKALIVSKLALVLASIIGLKKLVASGHGHESNHEVVVSAGHGGSGWGRQYDEAAQTKAYSAYAPSS